MARNVLNLFARMVVAFCSKRCARPGSRARARAAARRSTLLARAAVPPARAVGAPRPAPPPARPRAAPAGASGRRAATCDRAARDEERRDLAGETTRGTPRDERIIG